MSEENIAKKVLNQIKSKGIQPKPRWQFLLKDYLIWLFFGLTIIVGSLASSIIIFMVRTSDWDLYSRLRIPFFLKTLPYFWIIILLVFVFLAYYNFKHTKGGYHYRFYVIVLAAVFLSFFFGFIFHLLKVGELAEYRFRRAMPFYQEVFYRPNLERRIQAWSQPSRGLLMGEVISVENPNNFELQDFMGQTWTVFNNKGIIYRRPFELEQGIRLRAIGEVIDESNFKAFEVRPEPGEFWMPMKEKTPFMRIIK
jgi:hypothetical protein